MNTVKYVGWREILCINTFLLLLKLSTISTLLFVIQQCGFGLDDVMGFPYLWLDLAEKTHTPNKKHKPLFFSL
jgi:CRISPR/Cas system endoribonuclease Cas6 (RAMP superfamily)